MDFHEEDEVPEAGCAACGKAWSEHLGIQPICERLALVRATLEDIRALAENRRSDEIYANWASMALKASE